MKLITVDAFGRNPKDYICIGRQGENNATAVIFDCSAFAEIYGEGAAELLCKRPGDTTPYPCATKQSGNLLSWAVTETDTAKRGVGQIELRWYVRDTLAKSMVFRITILGALSTSVDDESDEPHKAWMDAVLSAGVDAKANAEESKKNAELAAQSEELVTNAATAATQSATAAKVSEAAAAESAAKAATSESNAAESATAAKASADAAAQSAAKAATSESNAAESASSAKSSQDAATESAAKAAASEGNAEQSATAAKASADAAAQSAAKAATSESNAAESASSAKSSQEAAAADAAQTANDRQVTAEKAQEAVDAAAATIAAIDTTFAAMMDDTNTTKILKAWWPLSDDGASTKTQRLNRFFAMCRNDKTYGVKFCAPEVSSQISGEFTDDSVGLSCELSTDSTQGTNTLDEHRAFFWLRCNAVEIDDQGTLDVKYIEIEDGYDPTGEVAPVYTLQVAPYIRKNRTETTITRQLRTKPEAGYHSWAEGRNPDGTQRAFVAHAAYGGGYDANGYITSGAGKRPLIRMSYSTGLTKIKAGRTYQTMWQSHDQNWLLLMWQLRHATLANSGQMEGCLSYSFQYIVAAGEENVKRVLLTAAQAKNFLVGCSVSVGNADSTTDRNTASVYNLADCVQVTSKETVIVGGEEFVALNLNIDSPITTTEITKVSTMPWYSGETDAVLGRNDGSPRSNTDGKNPCRCAGIEFLTGCYRIAAGELYNYAEAEDGSSELQVHACATQGFEASSVTSNYIDTGLRLHATTAGWQYIKAMDDSYDTVFFPSEAGGTGASSSTFYGDAFYHKGDLSGLCVSWLSGYLLTGVLGGLGCMNGSIGPSNANWRGAPGLSRRCWRGELTA